jgi:hypothetical protein
MKPFDFIILFFSFIYTLALTHLLFSTAQMIRRWREITFSWPHAIWMTNALMLLAGNWLALWDFRSLPSISLVTIAGGFVMVTGMYFICALMAPDLDKDTDLDLRAFHAAHGRSYIAAFLALCAFGFLTNLGAGLSLDISNWWRENLIVVPMLIVLVPPLISKRPWAQIGCPLVLLGLLTAFPIIYYPVLTG